jgi:cysteine desulfurase family protein
MIYLDNAATSFPKAPGVADAMAACIRDLPGSPGRASHAFAVAASELMYSVREGLAAFLGVERPERLAFTKNATEALNLAIMGYLAPRAGGRVLVSPFEHNSVMRPLRRLEADRGLRVEPFPCSPGGSPDLAALSRMLSEGADLLVVTAASNVTGAALPLAAILGLARGAGVPVLVDASQLVGHRPFDIGASGADLVAFSGHKGLLGPAGTGALYIKPGLELEPLICGGTGSASESEEQPGFLPDRFEAGTQNLAALAGLGAALEWLGSRGLAAIEEQEKRQRARLAEGLRSIEGLSVLPCDDEEKALPVVSATSGPMSESDLALELDRRGLAIRMGLHCSPSAHRTAGSYQRGGSLRFSPGAFTTDGEIDDTLAAMKEIMR